MGEAILVQAPDIVVFPPRILQSFREMARRSAIDSHDGAIDGASLVPAAAASSPHSSIEKLMDVFVVIVVRIMSNVEVSDAV